jgi:hypothetical protein
MCFGEELMLVRRVKKFTSVPAALGVSIDPTGWTFAVLWPSRLYAALLFNSKHSCGVPVLRLVNPRWLDQM